MIIENGHITVATKSGGGIDSATGYPVAESMTWGSDIPCQWRLNTKNNLGKSQGEAFTIATYEILIAMRLFIGERLRLYDDDDTLIGEFSSISNAKLKKVQIIRILV